MDPVLIIHLRQGARDCDRTIFEIGVKASRPAIRCDRDLLELLASGGAPVLFGIFGQGAGNVALDHHRGIVPRAGIIPVRLQTMFLLLVVRPRIPSIVGDVDAAAEGRVLVNDNDFLMVRASYGVMGIKLEMNPGMEIPSDQRLQSVEPQKGFERAGVPAQQIDFQIAVIAQQPVEIGSNPQRTFRCFDGVVHFHPLVEIPAEQHDPLLCLRQRLAHRAEIIFAVDQHCRPVGMLHAPAILSWLEYMRHGRSTFPLS